jgi:ubiquinone/menaquinone biosynthesis C-methylase UbiE
MNTNTDTSWGNVADWYDEHLSGDDTYHAKVIAPNLMRVLDLDKKMKVLDLGCGNGYFSRMIASSGASVIGLDVAEPLIKKARADIRGVEFIVADAANIPEQVDNKFDAIVCVLALQNMEHLDKVFKECARLLKKEGRFIFVLNHPAFRIPKKSSWGWDEERKVQYRRLDGYLSMAREKIDMSPSKQGKETTLSFHRSLQDYSKALANAGLAIRKMEEWISHKKSEKGPRSAAEDTARKEFPLFLMLETRPIDQ